MAPGRNVTSDETSAAAITGGGTASTARPRFSSFRYPTTMPRDAAAIRSAGDGVRTIASPVARTVWPRTIPAVPNLGFFFRISFNRSKAFRGSKAVHLKTKGTQAFITETATFTGASAQTNNNLWGRIWIWFETKEAPNSHDVFIRLEDTGSKAESAQLHVAGGSRGQLASELRFGGGDEYHPSIINPRPTTPPPGVVMFPLETPKWQCWEWHTTADNSLEFFIDGESYSKMSVSAADGWPFPIFKKLYLGFMQFGTTPATELWIDEVAVGPERIGCGN